MNLWIDAELISDEPKTFLPKGWLHILPLFKEDGYSISLDKAKVSKQQLALLTHEELLSDFEESGAQALVSKDKSTGEIILWFGETILASGFDLLELYQSYQSGLNRTATLQRTTSETDITIELNLDGTGESNIKTGLNFFDHMLEQISRHGLIDLSLTCDGDLEIDEHHTIEDVAIALGDTITKALGDKKGIDRYGFVLPMDEVQTTVSMDLSGRPYLVFEGEFTREYVGDFPTEMVKHFFYSLAMNLKATLHISFTGENDHHKVEACFKAFARTLKMAIEKNPRIKNKIPSSKGSL